MKGIWKNCLGLTAGLLAAGVQTIVASDVTDGRVIARTPTPAVCAVVPSAIQGSASQSSPPVSAASKDHPEVQGRASWTGPESRPLAVTLERPRPIAATLQQTSLHQPTVRGQAADPMPMPSTPPSADILAPAPRPVLPAPAIASGTPSPGAIRMPAGAFPGRVVPGMPIGPEGVPGFATDAPDIDPDRFAFGDGVSHQFTNLLFVDCEALLWTINGTRTPPLLTTGPSMPPLPQGAFGMPGTRVLIGDSDDDIGWHMGKRIRAGFWFDRDHALGVEASFLMLLQDSTQQAQVSSGSTFLGVPFVQANGLETALPIAGLGLPGMATQTLMHRLWGAEANVTGNLLSGPNGHVDLLGGFRCLSFDENFTFNTSSDLGGGLMRITSDGIDVRNRFWGGQLGVNAEYRYGRMSVEGTTRVAIGSNNQVVKTNGSSRFGESTANQGFFVQQNNLGRFSRSQFAVLPELGVRFGYQVTDCLRATLGYSLLYMSNVVRPTEQIDRVIGGNRPMFHFNSSDLWVHGLTLGMEMRY